ncbi:MAG TPA: VOC family protein [Solirubrobacteraceae bacterium]|jgi:catechol 2,3-dioxygenase
MPHEAIDPGLRIASVTIAVSDLERSSVFYERVLGLRPHGREDGRAWLGVDGAEPTLELVAIENPVPAPARSTGLFHVAWLHETRAALADTLVRVAASGWQLQGASDHGVSEAVYLADPDGLGIELYHDRPREAWQRPQQGHGVVMHTLPLDLDDLLASASAQPASKIDGATVIGHVHLKVSDLQRAVSFYRDALGFAEQARIPSASFLAAGDYHHHLGLNTWQSAGSPPAPAGAPGLRSIGMRLSSPQELAALERRLQESPSARSRLDPDSGQDLRVFDEDGNELHFASG